MDLQAWLCERTALVDELLGRLLPSAEAPPQSLHAAMRHLVFPGGKRLRPALALAAAEAVGARPEAALPMAAAVELVHTYSLIHDDLPCMDDDALRRGRPTVHIAFGEAVAVLAGDALLALAFESLAAADAGAAPRAAALGRAVRDLAVAAGAAGLVGGQVDDLRIATAAQGTPSDAAGIESIHRRKTAALMTAAVVGGARLGGANEEQLVRLAEFGQAVGVAFQIADDVLDADEDDGCSLVRVLGVGPARERAESLLDAALGAIEPFGERAEPLREIARACVRRKQ